ILATLTMLTAVTVGRALAEHGVEEVFASGGGTANRTLMSCLRDSAPGVRVEPIEALGIPGRAKEAYAFAVLGFMTVHGLPGTITACTGARRATVLGSITPGRSLPGFEAAREAPQRLRVVTRTDAVPRPT
ncbi:MAG: anhydro-N-acetylmuramic acid kinase, partial [Actinomycetota bacterium]